MYGACARGGRGSGPGGRSRAGTLAPCPRGPPASAPSMATAPPPRLAGASDTIHAGLLLAMRRMWDCCFLDAGPYAVHQVLVVATVARAPRTLTVAAVGWLAAGLVEFVEGGRRPALVDRFGLPTEAGRLAGVPWPPWLLDSPSPASP